MLDRLANEMIEIMKPIEVKSSASKNASYYNYSYSGGSDGSKYPGGISGSGRGIIFNHALLRANGRIAYHQTSQAHSLVTRMADTVADVGLRWEPMPNVLILGITPEEGEAWSRKVKARFDSFAKNKNQHRSGNMTFYQAQRLYQVFQHRDNDIFTRFYYSSDKDLLNPLQFEFVDPDQIRGDAFTSTGGMQSLNDGIERDKQGKEKAYKVWVRNSKGQFEPVTINAKSPDGARIMMLHGFMPEYGGQSRGLSRLGNDIQEFQKLTDLTLAEIQKAIMQSSIMGFVKPSDKEDAHNIFQNNLTNGGAGPAADRFGSSPAPAEGDEGVTTEGLAPLQCYDIPEATFSRPGATFIANLPAGQSIEMVKNTAPSAEFDRFVDSFTSYISSSKGMPIEVLLMKFGQNFSASRGALLLFWRVAQIWRDEMAADFLNPLVEMWMSEEIAAGRVSAPGWSDPRLKAAWLNSMWIGPPAPDIDPGKTSKARLNNIEAGVTTIGLESRNYNGSDAETNKATLTRELEDMPIPAWSKGFQGNDPVDADSIKDIIREVIDEIKEEDED